MCKKKLVAIMMSVFMLMGAASCGNTADGNTGAVTEAVTDAADNGSEDSSADSTENQNSSEDETSEQESGAIESSLQGTGPASPEDFVGGDEDDEFAIKDGDAVLDLEFSSDTENFGEYKNGGDFSLKNKDGKLVCQIKNCGVVDYANQAFHDGYSLSQGCVYTFSFDISCDIERQVEYRLQVNGGDYHAYQGEYIEVGPEELNFSVDFEMTEESDPAPRLCFNMGKMKDMTDDPGEHNIYIDNIKLVVKDSANAQAVSAIPGYVNVGVNQLGYKPDDKKIVVVKSDREDAEEFIVCDAVSNETVFVGQLGAPRRDSGAYLDVKQGDFTAFSEPGDYYIYTEEGASYPFSIKDDPYGEVYNDTILMLYRQRCGMAVEGESAGYAAHKECHMEEAVVHGNESVKKDVTGGWHDAGDYGRYIVSGAEAVADLLMAYRDYGIDDDNIGIPESGNGIPDILDEARYELDWMLKMQDEETGGVYHKVTGLAFPETVGPEGETATMYLSPISATATGDFAAVMALASVIYKDIDPEFSKTALAAAEKAWDYVKDIDDKRGFKNPSDISTGEYPDGNIWDEKYWAAAELYLAGRDDLENTVKNYINAENIGGGLGWADMASYADYDLARSDKTAVSEDAKAELVKDADETIKLMKKSGYHTGFGYKYPWGSNMTVANQSELLQMTYNVTGDELYKEYAKYQLDYLFGTNSLGYCFVTGYGTYSPEHPHHRPSEVAEGVITGMLVGGPNGGLEDPYAKTVLLGQAPAMCYVDSSQSYSTNEVAIYWNSPLIYALSAGR